MSSTFESVRPAPVGRPPLLRPIALAGALWLFIGVLFGLGTILVLWMAPVIAPLYVIVTTLFATFGYQLIAHRGLGLPLASMILGAVFATNSTLDVLRVGLPNASGDVVVALFFGAITASSVLGVWSAREEMPALMDGIGHRVLTALVVIAVIVGVTMLVVTLAGGTT